MQISLLHEKAKSFYDHWSVLQSPSSFLDAVMLNMLKNGSTSRAIAGFNLFCDRTEVRS